MNKKETLELDEGFVISTLYGRIANTVMENGEISKGAKVLYAYFISKAANKDNCFPSNNTIMKSLNMTRVTLSKYKTELENLKLLKIVERKEPSGRKTSNYYYPVKSKQPKK